MKKQKYFSPLGFTSPSGKCKNSSFASGCHRIGIFPISYEDEECRGYHIRRRCVNCGKWIGKQYFMISERRDDLDRLIESEVTK